MTLRRRLAATILLTALPLLLVLLWLRSDLERRSMEEGTREFVVARMEGRDRQLCEDSPETYGGSIMMPRGRTGRPPSRPGESRPARAGDSRPARGNESRPLHASESRPQHSGESRPMHASESRPLRPRPTPPPNMLVRLELWAYDSDFKSANPNAPPFPPELEEEIRDGEEVASASWEIEDLLGHQVAVRTRWKELPCAVMLVRRRTTPPSLPDSFLWGGIALCAAVLLSVLLAAGPIVRRIGLLAQGVRRCAAGRYEVPVAVTGKDELSRLAEAFNDAARELRSHLALLEEREKTLRSFLGNTTHDVMMPLTVLQGHLAAMRKRLDAGLPVEPALLLSACDEAHYMACLVHNLSAAAKLEAGEPHVRRDQVDLNGVVERAVARHAALARARAVSLDFAVPEARLRVVGDVTLIEQAASNLIHNAVRYNRVGGHVAVVLEQDGTAFSLRVIDDGPGIEEAEIARLPERYFRGGDARVRHPDGLGLGLHIARDVAKRHGFELQFRPSEFSGLDVELRGALAATNGNAPVGAEVAGAAPAR